MKEIESNDALSEIRKTAKCLEDRIGAYVELSLERSGIEKEYCRSALYLKIKKKLMSDVRIDYALNEFGASNPKSLAGGMVYLIGILVSGAVMRDKVSLLKENPIDRLTDRLTAKEIINFSSWGTPEKTPHRPIKSTDGKYLFRINSSRVQFTQRDIAYTLEMTESTIKTSVHLLLTRYASELTSILAGRRCTSISRMSKLAESWR